ncbi:hypothetical protein EI555_009817, partial [Monodon monoceros]
IWFSAKLLVINRACKLSEQRTAAFQGRSQNKITSKDEQLSRQSLGKISQLEKIKMDGMKWYHNFFNCSESQQKAEEFCPMVFMQLRSGLKIEKKTCYFRKETTKRHSPRTGKEKLHFLIIFQHNDGHLFAFTYHIKIHNFFPHPNSFWKRLKRTKRNIWYSLPVRSWNTLDQHSASLSTYNNQCITFVFEDGNYEIYVEDLGKDQEKGRIFPFVFNDIMMTNKVLLRYYDSQFPSSETEGGGDHRKLMVNLSPTKDKDFLLHANSKEHSVELQKCENQLPEQAFFVLHEETSQCVSFECKSNPGVFLGVKDNHLALIKRGEHPEDSNEENTIFKLSNLI